MFYYVYCAWVAQWQSAALKPSGPSAVMRIEKSGEFGETLFVNYDGNPEPSPAGSFILSSGEGVETNK